MHKLSASVPFPFDVLILQIRSFQFSTALKEADNLIMRPRHRAIGASLLAMYRLRMYEYTDLSTSIVSIGCRPLTLRTADLHKIPSPKDRLSSCLAGHSLHDFEAVDQESVGMQEGNAGGAA